MKASVECPVLLLSTSDIHLGHPRVDTLDITNKLRLCLFPRLKGADLLILGGDITDTAIGLGDAAAKLVIAFFIDLFRQADEHGVIIVMLRGTLSHDRNHLETLRILHERGGFKAPLYYADKLGLGYIPEYDLRVAFLPDNLPYSKASDALVVLHEQMQSKGWSTVDYAFVHGYFHHMLPAGLPREPQCTWRAEQFEFVNRYVLVGHVHRPLQEGKILNNGSFDRLAHGEEEDKGFLSICDDGTNAKITFIKNPYATPFITFRLTEESAEAAILEFQKKLKGLDLTTTNHIRVLHPAPEVRQAIGQYIAKSGLPIRYSHKSPTKEVQTAAETKKVVGAVAALTPPNEKDLPALISHYLSEHKRPLALDRITHHLSRITPL